MYSVDNIFLMYLYQCFWGSHKHCTGPYSQCNSFLLIVYEDFKTYLDLISVFSLKILEKDYSQKSEP